MSWENMLKAKGSAERQELHGRRDGWRQNPDWEDIARDIAKDIGYEGDERSLYLNVDDFNIDIEISNVESKPWEHSAGTPTSTFAVRFQPTGEIYLMDGDVEVKKIGADKIDIDFDSKNSDTTFETGAILFDVAYDFAHWHNGFLNIYAVLQ